MTRSEIEILNKMIAECKKMRSSMRSERAKSYYEGKLQGLKLFKREIEELNIEF